MLLKRTQGFFVPNGFSTLHSTWLQAKKKITSVAKVTAEEFSVGFDRDLEKRLKQVSAYRRKYLGLNSRNYFSSYFISYISSFIWNGMIFF